METGTYLVLCWNCLGEFDAISAVWCSDDPKNPTKLCPFCLRCFCQATEEYKKDFWRKAPAPLLDELQTLTQSKDRLGDILIRMHRITTPQLLETLVEQQRTGKRLGELLVAGGYVTSEDIAAALRTQGQVPLSDTKGVAYSATPVWEKSSPEAIIQYVLSLAARRGASDVHLEPKEDCIHVKYRIDGFFFRVDPIPKQLQVPFTRKLFEVFRLDALQENRPQTSRTSGRLGETDYDLVAQTLPTAHGVNATIKLINRSTFLKDFTTLGLEIDERVHLMENLRASFGLVLVTSPAFNGAGTTAYSIMDFLAQAQRDVISLEAPIYWRMDGVRQVEVESDGRGLRMEETLRQAIAVHPEVIVVSSIPDRNTATFLAQVATSVLVVALMPAQSAAQAITACVGMGVSPAVLADSLTTVSCQRLVRKVCDICKTPAEAPAAQTLAAHGIDPETAQDLAFYRGKGCPTCNRIGYRGRVAVFEVMAISPEIRGGIRNNLGSEELNALAIGSEMRSMRERCLDLIRQGVTTFDEFVRLRL